MVGRVPIRLLEVVHGGSLTRSLRPKYHRRNLDTPRRSKHHPALTTSIGGSFYPAVCFINNFQPPIDLQVSYHAAL